MKILIADDHALFRDNIALSLLKIKPDSIILQVSSFSQVQQILKKEQNIDFIILNLDMGDIEPLKALENLKEISDKLNIVIISSSEDINQIRHILEYNIIGYIPKSIEIQNLQEIFKQILSGEKYIPQALKDIENESINKINTKTLTNRQSQVLDLIAQGKSNKQIAYEIGVSEATVKLHINALLRSLKVNNRTQAVITAQKMGLI